MSTQFRGGVPQIQVLAADGTTVLRTLELPPPAEGGVKLHWKEKLIRQELVAGDERARRLGYIPILTMRWKVFDDVTQTAKVRGPLNGNRARFQDLLALLANPQGRLRVSPGPAPFGSTAVTDHGFGVGDGTTTTFQLQHAAGKSKVNALGETWPVPTTPRTNRIPRSADLTHAAWTKIAGGTGVVPTVTGNYGLAPDGTLTADRVVCQNGAGATGSDYSVVKIADVVGAMPPNQRTTRSVWLKSNTGANIPASLGSNGNAVAITITPTWTRVPMTYYHPTLTLTHTIDLGLVGSVAGNTSSTADFLVWEGQLEEGIAATENIHTDATAVTVTPFYWPSMTDGFEPCYGFSGTPSISRKDWQGKVQMYPTPRTNKAIQSQDYTNAAWSKAALTPSITGTAPDGSSTMCRLVESAATAVHAVYQLQSSINSGDWVIASVHISAFSATRALSIQLYGTAFPGGSAGIQVNPTAGTIEFTYNASGCTYGIVPLPWGGYRAWIRRQAGATGTFSVEHDICQAGVNNGGSYSYAGDGSSGVNAWGTMVEVNPVGTTPSSYIPTTTVAATVTDYTLTATGAVTFTAAPLASAILTWTGSFQEVRRGFRALVTKVPDAAQMAEGIATDVEVEFTGRDILSDMSLGVF